jgi:hypothetical protein
VDCQTPLKLLPFRFGQRRRRSFGNDTIENFLSQGDSFIRRQAIYSQLFKSWRHFASV